MMSRSGMRWPAVAGRETRQNTMYVGAEEVHVRPRQVGQPSCIIVDYHTPAVSYCEKVASKWAAKCLLQCVGGVGDTLIAGWWLDTHAVTHSNTYVRTYMYKQSVPYKAMRCMLPTGQSAPHCRQTCTSRHMYNQMHMYHTHKYIHS